MALPRHLAAAPCGHTLDVLAPARLLPRPAGRSRIRAWGRLPLSLALVLALLRVSSATVVPAAPYANQGFCAKAAHIWPLNTGNDYASSTAELDVVAGWNMHMYNGAVIDPVTNALYLSGSSAYGDFGAQTFGGNLSVALWVYLQTTNWCHILDFANGAGVNSFILAPGKFQVYNTALSCYQVRFAVPFTALHVSLTPDCMTAGSQL